jgi:putative transposase
MVEFLKTENQILRAKLPRRVEVTPAERHRLIQLGRTLRHRLRELLSIVSLRTFYRWLKAEENATPNQPHSSKGGRPKTPANVRALVLRMATENGWGFGRIVGELNKLGVTIAKTTVKAILRENGFDLGPKRGRGTWTEFVQALAKTLWACDFFQKKIWTLGGVVDYFALFFIHIGSRRVIMAGLTPNPTAVWVMQQARNLTLTFDQEVDKPTYLIRDNDDKFPARFDDIFATENMEVVRTCMRAPNMNAFIERWIQSLQLECLDHFVVFGEDHFRHLLESYLTHHNRLRPHQSLDNLPLDGHVLDPPAHWNPEQLLCSEALGGARTELGDIAATSEFCGTPSTSRIWQKKP